MKQVIDFFSHLFRYSDFKSLWQNGNWTAFHGWLYVISDLLVAGAYCIIPLLIFLYIRKQGNKVHFNGIYLLFALFILISGATYLIDAIMFWKPIFRFSAAMRLATALVSWITIYHIIRILPTAFTLKSPIELEKEVDRRMDVERTLKIKNEQLIEAERTAKLGYGAWDILRRQVDLSEMASSILGLTPGAIVNYQKLTQQIHPADIRFVEDCIQKNLRSDSFKPFYFRVLTDRMMIRHVLVRGEVLRNSLGQAIGIKGTLQDVTEIRTHLQRIELQNKKLKKIAWVQSHKMRSPVATILGLTELFNHDDPNDPMNAEIINSIKEQSQQLDKMIHEVDDLTRAQTKMMV
ncbi:MAG: PAS domain-containing protein [Bacteroidetes bacterium]|nr:PAS domain-containing protein [Bacteroidota bacterium]